MALLIQTVGISFAAYALLFLIANLFSATSAPIVEAIENSSQKSDSKPMPGNPQSDVEGGAT